MTTPNLPRGWAFYGGVRVSPRQLQFIEASVNRGLSLNRIQQGLQAAGIGLRRQAIVQARAAFSGAVQREPQLRALRRDFRPTSQTIQRVNWQMETRYQYRSVARAVIPNTGMRIDIPIRFGDDALLTRAAIEERSRDIFNAALEGGLANYSDSGDLFLESVIPTRVFEREP